MLKILPLLLCLSIISFAQDTTHIRYSLFFVGDAGEPYIHTEAFGSALHRKLSQASQATVLYLGDNVYPRGLVNKDERLRKEGELVLETQVSWLQGTRAQGIFIPGNHDWAHWGRKGYAYVLNQQQWLDSLHLNTVTQLPRDGCPGPAVVPLTDKAVLIIIDSQWFLHQWDKPEEDGSCEAKTPEEVMIQLNDILRMNRGKRIIIAAHHPLMSYGEHGGVFPFKSHIFPLLDISPHLYIPLPAIGSFYPLYRKWFGHIQDIKHPIYKAYIENMTSLLKEYPGSIYISGHEHALEYIVKDQLNMMVSGAGSKVSPVKKKGYAELAEPVRGFAQADIMDNGGINVHYFKVDPHTGTEEEIFSKYIEPVKVDDTTVSRTRTNLSKQFVKAKASDQYHAGKVRRKLFGTNYRAEWAQEIDVPVFDLSQEKGGLKILQRGGGMQTLSLRLEDSTGKEYVLRSVEKYLEKAVPEPFRRTFAQDIAQDQISASHPYAALVVPYLAEGVGVYHTNPKLVYIPDDPALGEYQKLFANTLALFEERPAGDWSDASWFGSSKKIINTTKVLEKLADDHDNHVDEAFVLKSRLFDLVIGDWDRHDDQWRWATIKGKKGDIYRPIPRDRDQAFYVNEGKITKFISKRWILPKFEGFSDEIKWPSGLSFNARYFDRTFLTELSKEEWIAIARELQQQLTDELIEQSIQQWPPSIFEKHGPGIVRALKQRRDKLIDYAVAHYEFLAREVEVVGSNKKEWFEVNRLPNGDTEVSVYKVKEHEKDKRIYHRLFHKDETHEIRLYGQGGDDIFDISGHTKKTILVRIIGGTGNDAVVDSSKVYSWGKKTLVYDLSTENNTISGHEIREKLSDQPDVNEYNRRAFIYNRTAPLIYGNYNPDDQVFIGGGFINITQGFRKSPYKARHIVLGSVAPLTRSYNLHYHGNFTELFGKWSLDLQGDIKAPNFVNNFFGWGNESVFNKNIYKQPGIDVKSPIQYYRYRFEEWRADVALSRVWSSGFSIQVGPSFQHIELEKPRDDQDRFIKTYVAELGENLFEHENTFAGVSWQVGIDKRNHPIWTTKGISWNVSGRNMAGLNKGTHDFSSYESSLAFYQSFKLPARITFAWRVGGGMNNGKYEFYQAQILDGKTQLRGFRKTRFYGDSKLYSNFEVRLKLANLRSYYLPGAIGMLAFTDVGRVWYKDANGIDPSSSTGNSHVWHQSIGGGLWITPFNLTVLSAEVGHSEEGNLFYIRMGFLF
jgi:hypothetical protein